jgi:hypothetical protein
MNARIKNETAKLQIKVQKPEIRASGWSDCLPAVRQGFNQWIVWAETEDRRTTQAIGT